MTFLAYSYLRYRLTLDTLGRHVLFPMITDGLIVPSHALYCDKSFKKTHLSFNVKGELLLLTTTSMFAMHKKSFFVYGYSFR